MAYIATGHIGLLLATPPGFATAVWPASGIALGWVLLYGWRLLPGVVLGSFVVNLEISLRASGAGLFEVSWAVPLLIALGAAVQAAAGAWLIRRWAGFPSALDEPQIILKTLVLGGIVATAINASWSVLLLSHLGIIPAGRWLQNWVTWWVGDSIGVLVFTPVILAWGMRKPYFHQRRAIIVTLVLIAAFSATVLGFLLVAKLEETDRVSHFNAASALAVTQFTRSFTEYESFSLQVRGLFDSQGVVTPVEFSVFAHEWLQKHPEVRAVQWAPLISLAERASVEARLTEQLGKPVRIQDFSKPNPGIAGIRDEYVPLLYTEPVEPARQILGFDILNAPNRGATLQAASEAGTPSITPPVSLILEGRERTSVMLYTPVYQGREHHGQGWSQTRGFVILVLKMDEVAPGLTQDILPQDLSLVLIDQPTGTVLSGLRPDTRTMSLAGLMNLQYQSTGSFGQRQWQLEVWPTASYLEHYNSWLTWIVLVIGLLVTSMAVSFTLITFGRRQFLERTVASRTHDLMERNTELEEERQKALEINRALEIARLEAVYASQAKGQFLANMSHEIRTPMNAIIGFTHLLLNSGLKGKHLEHLTHIDMASRSLLGLINDILDFSKIEAGRMDLHEESFRLDELLQNTVQQVMLPATAKGLEIALDISPDVPIYLRGDFMRLGQVMLNLCNNAVKFTEHGDIVIGVDLDTESPSGRKLPLHFWVQDSGVGIEAERLPRLFTPFTQADESITRRYGGTGLGLAICKRLVELMGGDDIAVTSSPGAGSIFHFVLPMARDEAAIGTEDPCNRRLLGRLRVLVVDDSASARTILVSLLQQMGLEATAVATGEDALQAIVNAAWDSPYDLVLLDWQMPGWDGLETAQRIWDEPTLAKVPPLFLVTGHSHVFQQGGFSHQGIAACLDKPVTVSALSAAMLKHFQGPVTDPLPPLRTSLVFAPSRILLVEDNDANRLLATEMMSRMGLSVEFAVNGQAGLQKLEQALIPFDLVLMDLQMPIMDGYQAAAKMRQLYTAKELPIIAMTAYAMPADRQRCISVGMNAHLAKPVDMAVLAAMLARFLPLRGPEPEISPKPPGLMERDRTVMEMQRLNLLLRRQSFDARAGFEALHAELANHCPVETAELVKLLAKLNFVRARQMLDAIALKMEVPLE